MTHGSGDSVGERINSAAIRCAEIAVALKRAIRRVQDEG